MIITKSGEPSAVSDVASFMQFTSEMSLYEAKEALKQAVNQTKGLLRLYLVIDTIDELLNEIPRLEQSRDKLLSESRDVADALTDAKTRLSQEEAAIKSRLDELTNNYNSKVAEYAEWEATRLAEVDAALQSKAAENEKILQERKAKVAEMDLFYQAELNRLDAILKHKNSQVESAEKRLAEAERAIESLKATL